MNATNCFKLNEVRFVDRLADLKGSIPAQEDLAGNDHLFGIDIPVIENDEIDLLIGTGASALHVVSEVRREGDTGFWAGNTWLSWVLFGHDNHQANVVVDKSPEINFVNLIATQDPLEKLTSRYSTLQDTVRSTAWLLKMKRLFCDRAANASAPVLDGPIGAKNTRVLFWH